MGQTVCRVQRRRARHGEDLHARYLRQPPCRARQLRGSPGKRKSLSFARPHEQVPMSRIPIALLVTALAGHASAQGQASAPTADASQAATPTGAAAARMVAASPLGACFRRQPAYPVAALRDEQEGQTVVAFTVAAAGPIQNPGLLRSSGHQTLDRAALAHLNQCIASVSTQAEDPLPPGRYALPMVWRIE
ncbi:TonB family protein [Hydrogenophaga sp.]|uniref:TonB family protein n=1 Tax=Hydrogenophaga sp. TaxID=1904254 RepID=UPI003FA55651